MLSYAVDLGLDRGTASTVHGARYSLGQSRVEALATRQSRFDVEKLTDEHSLMVNKT